MNRSPIALEAMMLSLGSETGHFGVRAGHFGVRAGHFGVRDWPLWGPGLATLGSGFFTGTSSKYLIIAVMRF